MSLRLGKFLIFLMEKVLQNQFVQKINMDGMDKLLEVM